MGRRSTAGTRARLAVAATAAALAALIAPASALAAAKGLDTDLTWGSNSATQTSTANVVQDAGATWARLTISWHDTETSPGNYNQGTLSATDNAVALLRARGVHVLIDVLDAPQWASGSATDYTPPSDPATYASFVQAMAARYRGEVDAWEIWNEENIPRFWATGPDAGRYASLLRAAYPAVKAGDPNALVVFGGLSENDYGFVQSAYGAMPDLGRYYDVMATHPYPGNNPPDLTVRAPDGRIASNSFDGYREVRQTMLAHGDDKPIWFTEFGWATYPGGVDQATQARDVALAYECVAQDSYVQVALYYNLRNNYWASDALDWEDQLGLLNTNFSPKPAYAAFKSYAPGTGGCSYHEASAPPATATASGAAGGSAPGHLVLSFGGRRPAGGGRVYTISGHARGRRVVVVVERRVRGRWVRWRAFRTRVARNGVFRRVIGLPRGGKVRVRVFAMHSGVRALVASIHL